VKVLTDNVFLLNCCIPAFGFDNVYLAAVLVRHHVKQHWSTLSDKFVEPMTSDEEKAAIRELLPQALADPSPKIRNAAVRSPLSSAQLFFRNRILFPF
jgi:hypothetical protein